MPTPLGDEALVAQRGRQTAAEYYESVRGAFRRASHDAGELEKCLEIGDVRVKLRFAGSELSTVLLPAFSRVLGSGSGPGDFEVELWDEATTGVGIPSPPWNLRELIARGDVRTASGRIRAQVDRGNRIITMWDRERRSAIMWAAAAHRLPYWVRAAPLRSILHWGLASPRRHVLHAAAVGDERSGALLVGPAGSGKSTTALACVRSGLGYAGDDCVLVETEPFPCAHSMYGIAKLNAPSVKLLPGLPARRPSPDDASKFTVDVARAQPWLMKRSVAVSAVILPQVTAGRVLLRPASAAQALRALAPSTILQHADESTTGLALMSRLVRRVPAYILELGSDITSVGPAIRHLLEAVP